MSSLDRNIIEEAYAFFHQKEKVQAALSDGIPGYLKEHSFFESQLSDALGKMLHISSIC